MTALNLVYRAERLSAPSMAHVLGASTTPVKVTRLDGGRISLESVGGYLREPWSALMRSPTAGFAAGDTRHLAGLDVAVETITIRDRRG